ncbi:origin recognition complex subunit 4-like [Dorcoceras hygrometricum]|uniref:Origin of replication complex subunit 4 n=1 Tax=Dorcoceras hygrometricum TaxID=472368 RepID=A0A2Z7BTI0_9LAMI|nr:origin recognition complex subunit 4-like [Dorcoceras hygrometricum]
MCSENHAEQAQIIIRRRLCSPSFIFSIFSDSPNSNYRNYVYIPLSHYYADPLASLYFSSHHFTFSKLKYIVSSSVTEACNNSVLLLGPRGCGKNAVLELVLEDLSKEHPDLISVIRLNGLLHSDDSCALKEIARQLCIEHQLLFSKMASSDDNTQFLVSMLQECGFAHKTIIFVLNEFDRFAQGKQRLLYSLLDAMQSVTSQAVVIGVSCRLMTSDEYAVYKVEPPFDLDADQLLEKRIRSRFSHRKLVFLPLSPDDLHRLLEHILLLPTDASLPHDYVAAFNAKLLHILADEKFKGLIDVLSYPDSTVCDLSRFLFSAVCRMDSNPGFLSLENFKAALPSVQRQPKMGGLNDCSVLELYILVCMKRLEVKELELCNFNSIMKEYKSIHDTFQTSDYYAWNVCLRAFEHLLQRGLISFEDNRGHLQSSEFRPVKLLISWQELQQGLKSHLCCPVLLHKLMDRGN